MIIIEPDVCWIINGDTDTGLEWTWTIIFDIIIDPPDHPQLLDGIGVVNQLSKFWGPTLWRVGSGLGFRDVQAHLREEPVNKMFHTQLRRRRGTTPGDKPRFMLWVSVSRCAMDCHWSEFGRPKQFDFTLFIMDHPRYHNLPVNG